MLKILLLLLLGLGAQTKLVMHRRAKAKWNLRHALKTNQETKSNLDSKTLDKLLATTDDRGLAPLDGALSQKRVNYFIYDLDPPNYGERFSTRKRYALSAFHFIKALEEKGKKWVLVLAPFVDSFDGQRAFHSWRYLFDIPELSKYHDGIMDYDEFIKQNADKPVYFGSLDNCDIPEKGFPPYKLEAGSTSMKAMGHPVTIDKQPICIDKAKDDLVDRISDIVGDGGGAVFLTRFFYRMTEDDNWELRQHWAFAKVLLDEVARFKRDDKIAAPYLGVHLRRNDWKWAHKNTMSTLEDSVKAIVAVAKERGITHVFIATDIQDFDEEAKLRKLVEAEGLTLHRYMPEGQDDGHGHKKWLPGWVGTMKGSLIDHSTPLGSQQLFAVDQILCAHADAFIGTFGSGFSAEIHFERRRAKGAGMALDDSLKLSIDAGTTKVPLAEPWGHY